MEQVFTPSNLTFAAFWLWDTLEASTARRYARQYKPFPLPSAEQRRYNTSDVSIIIPTVDTDRAFVDSLGSFIDNGPREILIVTVRHEETRVQELVTQAVAGVPEHKELIKILTVEHANKRDQLVEGINNSSGSIIALADDDAFWRTDAVLTNLLAPFQDPDVGLVGGPITSHMPEERKQAGIITPWEVAAIRLRTKRDRSIRAAFAADGGINFCVSGATMLLRAEIVRDPAFQHAFTREMWMGKRQNTGDDGFITRWVLFHRRGGMATTTVREESLDHSASEHEQQLWKLYIQHTPEAEVSTSIMPDARFIGQLKRWYRSGLRLRLTCLLFEPGVWEMWRVCPYMARKMVEGMLNPILLWVRFFVWWRLLYTFPSLAGFYVGFLVHQYCKDIEGFIQQFEWCGRHLWAAILVDRVYLVSDWYCWLTLTTEAWLTRDMIDEYDLGPIVVDHVIEHRGRVIEHREKEE